VTVYPKIAWFSRLSFVLRA